MTKWNGNCLYTYTSISGTSRSIISSLKSCKTVPTSFLNKHWKTWHFLQHELLTIVAIKNKTSCWRLAKWKSVMLRCLFKLSFTHTTHWVSHTAITHHILPALVANSNNSGLTVAAGNEPVTLVLIPSLGLWSWRCCCNRALRKVWSLIVMNKLLIQLLFQLLNSFLYHLLPELKKKVMNWSNPSSFKKLDYAAPNLPTHKA